MLLRWVAAALALIWICIPDRPAAQARARVLDGRAEISVPPGFSRDHSEVGRAQDRFYLMRFVDLLASEVPHVPPGQASVERQLRAVFEVIEIPLDPAMDDATADGAREFTAFARQEIVQNSARGVWCPFVSNPEEVGIFAGMHDPATGFSHCFGAAGAAIYLVCRKFPDTVLCISGIDMVEFAKAERAGFFGHDESWPDARLLAALRGAGNVDVLEAVLESFRYR